MLGRNLSVGLVNSIWSAVVGLAMVPLYLRYLGMEAYGLIGFFVTLQAVLSLLDMGMAPTINREVARGRSIGNLRETGRLLHTLAVVYWSSAVLLGLAIALFAPWIAEHWLNSARLGLDTVSRAVMMMGLVAASRWPAGLYQGALLGAQRLDLSSAINMATVTLGALGAIGALALLSPTIDAYFASQVVAGLIHTFAMRAAAWQVVGREDGAPFDAKAFQRVWRFTAGMGGVAITGLVFTQLDKVILSKVLALEGFGHYMLAATVASGLSVCVAPVFNTIYPRFCSLVAAGSLEALKDTYASGTRLFATVIFPVAMALAVFAEDVVLLWVGDQATARDTAPVVALLLSGSALNGVMYFPYALQLSFGATWIPLSINFGLMLFMIPSTIFLAQNLGALGGGLAWLAAEVAYVAVGTWLTHRYLLPGMARRWLFRDVGAPLLITMVIGACAWLARERAGLTVVQNAMMAVLSLLLTFLVIMALSGAHRATLWRVAGWLKRQRNI